MKVKFESGSEHRPMKAFATKSAFFLKIDEDHVVEFDGADEPTQHYQDIWSLMVDYDVTKVFHEGDEITLVL